jgi:4-amino-4-deoxy-L-arabinose transferase-like glycosyltransferase
VSTPKKPAPRPAKSKRADAAETQITKTSSFHAPVKSDHEVLRKATGDSILLFIASVAFFLFNIQFPKTRNFDEFHYIPSAEQWIQLVENQNWEHPPLAKLLISVGIRLFGSEPFGWRFMSVIFGGITLVAMYRIAFHLFGRDRKAGWICAGLTLFNQLLYVQSRIAMLDTFMMGFLGLSLWHFIPALDRFNFDSRWIKRAGIFMGLAIACKWFAIVPWAMCGALLLVQAIRLGARNRWLDLVSFWIITPLSSYYVTFLPYLWV